MEDGYIAISTLNDFIFCPYSIYLHNVYVDTDKDVYHAKPQTRGKNAHEKVDIKNVSKNNDMIEALPIISHELEIYGKIDVYNVKAKSLIERKYALKNIYRGQYYQLWAQYFCMIEMGYDVDIVSFYEISTRKTITIEKPTNEDKEELKNFIRSYRNYDLRTSITINPNKCSHCIYCSLCDKTNAENVYS